MGAEDGFQDQWVGHAIQSHPCQGFGPAIEPLKTLTQRSRTDAAAANEGAVDIKE
jgi:hypothetical protein